jgi:hypothetical protein
LTDSFFQRSRILSKGIISAFIDLEFKDNEKTGLYFTLLQNPVAYKKLMQKDLPTLPENSIDLNKLVNAGFSLFEIKTPIESNLVHDKLEKLYTSNNRLSFSSLLSQMRWWGQDTASKSL